MATHEFNIAGQADNFRRLLTLGLGAQLLALPAVVAQDAAPEAMEATVVTGTRLTGAEAEGTFKVDLYKAEAVLNQGYVNTAEMLRRKVPQFGGGIGTVNDGFGNGGSGAATISLRNLPGNRTLVLLNGRRTTADLNLLPQLALGGTEILNDGASSIYGSDAVAGVVNFRTRQGFDGVEVFSYYGNTFDTDISDFRVASLWGKNTENSSFLAGIEYSHANSQLSVDRAISRPAGDSVSATSNPGTFTPRGLPSNRTPLRWSLNPAFNGGATFALNDPSQIPAGFTPVASINNTGLSASQAVAARNAEEARLNGLLPANSPVRYGPSPSLAPGVNPGFPFGFYTIAVRPYERYNAFGSAQHDIFGKNLEIFADILYSRNQSENILAPSPLGGRVLPSANYWMQKVFPGTANAFTFGYRPVELGPRVTFTDFELARVVAGLKGQIGDSTWKWESAFTHDRQEVDDVQTGGVLADKYNTLLGGTTAASSFNPFGYTPIGSPVGGSAANSADTIQSLRGSAGSKDVATLQMFDFNIGGEVFDLPGGAVAVNAGYELRQTGVDSQPDFALLNGLVFPFNADSSFTGSRDVNSVFGEVNIPIIGGDISLPGVQSFNVSVAGRNEHFSDLSPHSTGFKPRVAFRWEVLESQLTVRGSWAQGFVAPGLRSLSLTAPFQSYDELLNPLTGTRTQPEEGVIYVGNDKLKPSTSDSFLIGTVYSPKFIKGLSLGLNYYRIQEANIPFTSSQYIVSQWYAYNPNNPEAAGNPFGANAAPSAQNPTGAQVELKADKELYQVRNVGPINSGERMTDGIDLNAEYFLETGIGKFTLSGAATRVLTFEQEDFPGAGSIDYLGRYWGGGAALGNYGFPQWKANTGLLWEWDRYSIGFAWNFVDGYKEQEVNDRQVENYQTFDLRVGYKIHKIDALLSAGINNLFDEAPPRVLSSFENQYDRAIGDVRQRMYFVSMSKKF
ncbi:MAG: TonB-dependent receptor plug domain-containing protein [Verrucomicrobiota bacterium]